MSQLVGSETSVWLDSHTVLRVENNGFAVEFRKEGGKIKFKIIEDHNRVTRSTMVRWRNYATAAFHQLEEKQAA